MLFVFSIPFQAYETGFSERASLSKISGYLLLLIALLYPHVSLRHFPKGASFFLAYLVLFTLSVPFQPTIYQAEIRGRLFTLVQVLVLFWISYNLFRIAPLARRALEAFAVSCSLVGLGNILGLTSEAEPYRGAERITAFGADPNSIGSMLGLGALALLGLVYARSRPGAAKKLITWILLAIVTLAIAKTGSRGAMVSLCGGLLVFLVRRGTTATRLRNLLIVVMAFGVVIWTNFSLEMNVHRWEKTVESGSMAGRERIYPAAWRLFLERPLVGWGAVSNYYALGRRLGLEKRDTHNVFLWVMTEGGVVSTVPFCAGLVAALIAAWRARPGPHGVLPLAMMVTVMLVNMSITWLTAKLFWMTLAFAFASSAAVGVKIVRGTRRLQTPAERTSSPRAAAIR